MHTDYFYTKGSSHAVCEDFVIDGMTSSGIHFVILSDGCSSQPLTDVGTRILALETIRMLHLFGWDFFKMKDSFTYVVENAKEYTRNIGLPEGILTATLLVLAADEETIRVLGMGDGGFVIFPTKADKLLNGTLLHSPRIRITEYKENYPMYPIYLREKRFYMPESNTLIKHVINLETGESIDTEHGFKRGFSLQHSFKTKDVKFIGIFSDGMESFLDNEMQLLPVQEIMRDLTDFKQIKGNFIQRRMNGFLKKSAKKEWEHFDDLSFGGIWIGDQDEVSE